MPGVSPTGVRRYVAELVAASFLALTVLAAAAQDLLLGALAIAAMVAVLLRCGVHGNPVLTLAAVLARRTPPAELLPCWAAQFVGALLAAGLGRWLLTAPAVTPLQDVQVLTLLVVQVLFAFALCYVVVSGDATEAVGWSSAEVWPPVSAGLVVVAASAVLDPVAGAAFSPACAFALVVGGVTEWAPIWTYAVGCPAGGALAGLLARQASSRPG